MRGTVEDRPANRLYLPINNDHLFKSNEKDRQEERWVVNEERKQNRLDIRVK